jgi:late competence protein required for DNA uptake (superfamily II DNA/RNA helicase)
MKCARCGETTGKLVADVATGTVYCDWCATELRNVVWNVPWDVPLTDHEPPTEEG